MYPHGPWSKLPMRGLWGALLDPGDSATRLYYGVLTMGGYLWCSVAQPLPTPPRIRQITTAWSKLNQMVFITTQRAKEGSNHNCGLETGSDLNWRIHVFPYVVFIYTCMCGYVSVCLYTSVYLHVDTHRQICAYVLKLLCSGPKRKARGSQLEG